MLAQRRGFAGKSAGEANGDGLAVLQLVEEAIGIDVAQIPVRLSEIGRDLADARDLQAERSANLATANAELGKISGNDDAARAESARQDALSRMGDAAERFIKVHIAGKLLRWAIDRFRETVYSTQTGHGFHGKLDTHSTRTWTVGA